MLKSKKKKFKDSKQIKDLENNEIVIGTLPLKILLNNSYKILLKKIIIVMIQLRNPLLRNLISKTFAQITFRSKIIIYLYGLAEALPISPFILNFFIHELNKKS